MRATLILLGAICTAAASDVKLINRRDAMPLPDAFVNAIRGVPALKKRDSVPPRLLAGEPSSPLHGRGLESRQWGCETVGQINCAFEGCCNVGTVCGTYGGLPGCCPVGKTCTGVGSCKTSEGETSCGALYCCPKNAVCATDTDGSKVCDYGTSGSSSTKTLVKSTPVPVPATSTSSVSSTSTSLSCPGGYSPCAGSDTCCPAGAQCLSGGKCNVKCTAADVKCGTGCCKDGFTCDQATFLCEGSGTTDETGDSSSNSSNSAIPTLKPTPTLGSGGSSSTTGGSTSQTSVGAGGGGNTGITVSSPGSRLAAGMAMAGIVAALGIVLL